MDNVRVGTAGTREAAGTTGTRETAEKYYIVMMTLCFAVVSFVSFVPRIKFYEFLWVSMSSDKLL